MLLNVIPTQMVLSIPNEVLTNCQMALEKADNERHGDSYECFGLFYLLLASLCLEYLAKGNLTKQDAVYNDVASRLSTILGLITEKCEPPFKPTMDDIKKAKVSKMSTGYWLQFLNGQVKFYKTIPTMIESDPVVDTNEFRIGNVITVDGGYLQQWETSSLFGISKKKFDVCMNTAASIVRFVFDADRENALVDFGELTECLKADLSKGNVIPLDNADNDNEPTQEVDDNSKTHLDFDL
jgi:hypothetical protein